MLLVNLLGHKHARMEEVHLVSSMTSIVGYTGTEPLGYTVLMYFPAAFAETPQGHAAELKARSDVEISIVVSSRIKQFIPQTKRPRPSRAFRPECDKPTIVTLLVAIALRRKACVTEIHAVPLVAAALKGRI